MQTLKVQHKLEKQLYTAVIYIIYDLAPHSGERPFDQVKKCNRRCISVLQTHLQEFLSREIWILVKHRTTLHCT